LSFLSEGGAYLRLRVEGKERRRIKELFPLHSPHSFILSLEKRAKESLRVHICGSLEEKAKESLKE
jgi:hypothetical protein